MLSIGNSIAVSPIPLVSVDIGSIVNDLHKANPYNVTLCTPGSSSDIAHP